MRQVEKWRWRITWAGRSTVTRAHFSEEEIRVQHPEAVRVEGSRLVELPETQDEITAGQRPADRSGTRDDRTRVAVVDAIRELAQQVLGSREIAERWMYDPALGLGGRPPIVMLAEPGGEGQVRALLGRMANGVYT